MILLYLIWRGHYLLHLILLSLIKPFLRTHALYPDLLIGNFKWWIIYWLQYLLITQFWLILFFNRTDFAISFYLNRFYLIVLYLLIFLLFLLFLILFRLLLLLLLTMVLTNLSNVQYLIDWLSLCYLFCHCFSHVDFSGGWQYNVIDIFCYWELLLSCLYLLIIRLILSFFIRAIEWRNILVWLS